jgi:hypothetical protein
MSVVIGEVAVELAREMKVKTGTSPLGQSFDLENQLGPNNEYERDG